MKELIIAVALPLRRLAAPVHGQGFPNVYMTR